MGAAGLLVKGQAYSLQTVEYFIFINASEGYLYSIPTTQSAEGYSLRAYRLLSLSLISLASASSEVPLRR